MSYTEAYDRVFKRIQTAAAAVCVFIHAGKVRTMNADAVDMDKLIRSKATKVLGVYDARCEPKWLYEDLQWADVHYAVQ